MDVEKLKDKARQLCREHGVAVLPYGNAWWLVGNGVSRVVGELAGLCVSDIVPMPLSLR